MILIFVLTLGIIIASSVKSEKMHKSLKESLNRTLVESDEKPEYYLAWHYIQTTVIKPTFSKKI